jgi:hypothetical protein
MGRFTVIPKNTFDALQMDAGILLKRFNPMAPAFVDSDIICATTGGINPSCVPTYSDLGEDVDNCPNGMKELAHLDGWECKISTTSLGTSPELIRFSLGAADINAETGAIVPRKDLKQTDFADIWWVGDRADGGLVAVRLINALSTGGFSLQTTKNGKGQIALELTGHVSINDQETMPMEFYSMDPEDITAWAVNQFLSHVTSSFTDSSVENEDAFEAELTADKNYEIASVVVTMNGEDVTETAYNDSTGTISIASVTGNILIVATAINA